MTNSKIYDCITFNGEYDLFEIRYNILKNYVDKFIVVEFDKTFSGKPKIALFAQKWPKIRYYFIIEDIWSEYKDLAVRSPNTEYGKGAKHWIREFCQKEAIKGCLTDLQDDDIILIGDCDEIPNPKLSFNGLPVKLKLKVYSYYLNNRSNEQFWGTLVGFYKDIKNEILNHLRSRTKRTEEEQGWHFTSLKDGLRRKLEDSYTQESYATPQVMDNLDKNIAENKDFLGRDFKYWTDESDWPQYLKDNREKYKYLLK